MLFLLDTNTFIQPYDNYYQMDLFPTYWKKLSETSEANLAISDHVEQELKIENKPDKKDELQIWVESNFNGKVYSENTGKVIENFQKVMEYVRTADYYSPRAFDEWSNDIADPWIIAVALAEKLTVVTLEKRHGNLDANQPTRKVKVPDVCDALGVECLTLNELLREVDMVI